jgi:hypothetical protein
VCFVIEKGFKKDPKSFALFLFFSITLRYINHNKHTAMTITFRLGNTVQIFRSGITSNKKIAAPKEKIVQSFSFAKAQFNEVAKRMSDGTGGFNEFFELDAEVCLDCPFSRNSGNGGCYTHKITQYFGFISSLKSQVRKFSTFEEIPEYSEEIYNEILKISKDKFVRFGSYGEPSLHPLNLVKGVSEASKNWTGYTHQYFRKPEYSKYFMASAHNSRQAETAKSKFDYRSFIATRDNKEVNAVICPASKEGGFKSNCSACGLCSGGEGKGKVNVVILEH